MKKTKIKYKGKLKSYMQWPVVFLVILAIMNVAVYTVSVKAGLVVSGFLALFGVLTLLLIFRHRPLILNDLISFATQYGQVQKTLLDEFSIPYALLDSDGRLIWMNEEFSLTVGKDKDYRKNIQTLFPEIHSGTMPGLKGVKEIEIHYEDKDFCARLQRVSVQSLEDAVNILEIPKDRNYVIALYLFDNTELNHYIQENQDQKMVPGLIYLDNYDEALDSVEEVRRSLLVALIAVVVNMVIGIVFGGISGYLGGMVDTVMMRIVDIISTIPLTLYVILIMVLLGAGIQSIIIAIGTTYWVDMARVVRGQVLSLKNQEFVMAARTIGSSTKTILLEHLIPNSMGSILVTVTMLIPSAIFMEAFLSYLGIGLQPPLASLGTMCNDATQNLRTCPYQLFIPALVICLIMFGFNFIGDGLRDALDPKLKK